MATQQLMKDGLGPVALRRIADALHSAWKDFPRQRFMRGANDGLEELELKQRVRHIIGVLQTVLPPTFPEQAKILARLSGVWHPGDPGDPLRGFAAWPLIDLVAVTGLDHPDLALRTLRGLTPMFSAEFAIRPFLVKDWDLCARHLHAWVEDTDAHVRRLVSEGSRPRLPWGLRLNALVRDPSPTLPLLESLKDDPSDYVRRSVANHLNDIGKDHPDRVVDICGRWSQGASPERAALIRHATRSLVKAGHRGALALHGAAGKPRVEVESFTVAHPTVRMGESQSMRVALVSTARASQRLLVDFAVHFQKADGEARPKVFKWMVLDLPAGGREERSKAISFKPITTRRHYPGAHRVELLVNGESLASASFQLRD